MRIGELVRQHIEQIFAHCDNNEIDLLLYIPYSKKIFGINFPFCIEVKNINEDINRFQPIRYWTEEYSVRGKQVRVTSQWFEENKLSFIKYLEAEGIEHTQVISK